MADSRSTGGSSPSIVAPFIIAKRVAFQILLANLLEAWTQSSPIGTSIPGLAPRARVKRTASEPYLSIQSSGLTTLPKDFDIFLPRSSRTMPCRAMVWNGGVPSIAYRPNIIIRATQKKRMSYPVTRTAFG